jgi:hypothetical protein
MLPISLINIYLLTVLALCKALGMQKLISLVPAINTFSVVKEDKCVKQQVHWSIVIAGAGIICNTVGT